MKIILYVFCLFASLLVFSGFASAQDKNRQLTLETNSQTSQKRIALVIGNAAYTNAKPLANSANDANDMATTLKFLGFEVFSGVNQNKRQIETLIRQFGTKLAETKGTGLFYYAGHGLQVNGENYLVPIDAEIPEQDEVQYQAVPMNLVLSKMNSAGNDLNIVILDACRNNPFARSWRGFRDTGESDGLARITPPQGTIVLYATQPGNVASDGTGRNGLFTESLLLQIKKPNVELDAMIKTLTREVSEKSNRKQFPWREGSSTGDFYFAANATMAAKPAGDKTAQNAGEPNFGNATNAADIEREAFIGIQNSTKTNEIRAVLEEYPTSKYATAAHAKLDRLVWESVKDSRDKAKIQGYLDEFNDGQYAVAARIELKKLITATINDINIILGNWNMLAIASGQEIVLTLKFEQNGDGLTGLLNSALGEGTIDKAIMSGKNFTAILKMNVQGQPFDMKMEGTIDGNKMTGTMSAPGMPQITFTANKGN